MNANEAAMPLARSKCDRPCKRGKGTSRCMQLPLEGARCSHEAKRRRRRGGEERASEREAHSIPGETDSGRTKRDRDATAKDKVGVGTTDERECTAAGQQARKECRERLGGRPGRARAGWERIWATTNERTGNGFADGRIDRSIEQRAE